MTNNILSPINHTENSVQFYLNGRVFEMIGSEINELELNQIDPAYAEKIRAIQTFSFTNENVKWYYGSTRFSYNIAEKKFAWGTSEVLAESFAKHIFAAGIVKYEHMVTAELFEKLPSMLESYTYLDFVACFEGNSNTVDLMKVENNIYVSRFNSENRIAKFFKAESATSALEYVKEQTGQDASAFLVEFLETESVEIAEKAKTIMSYESTIVFLKEQRELLANADKRNAEIKAADKLINEEIKGWEAKIAELKA
mgnify:FL=1|jgi:hypothetical protein